MKEHWLAEYPLPDYVVPGATIRVFINEDNPHNGLLHIRAIIDDYYVAYKTWWRHKRRWSYEIEDSMWWAMWHAQGWLSVAHKPQGTGHRRWTEEEEAYLLAEVKAGASRSAIAQVLGRTPGAIKERILRLRYDGLLPYRRAEAVDVAALFDADTPQLAVLVASHPPSDSLDNWRITGHGVLGS